MADPIDMPATPANPSTYKASNNVTYAWDGVKWTAVGADSGGGSDIVTPDPPPSPAAGDLWYNTNDGILYIWYVDEDQSAANGEGQWVDVRPGND